MWAIFERKMPFLRNISLFMHSLWYDIPTRHIDTNQRAFKVFNICIPHLYFAYLPLDNKSLKLTYIKIFCKIFSKISTSSINRNTIKNNGSKSIQYLTSDCTKSILTHSYSSGGYCRRRFVCCGAFYEQVDKLRKFFSLRIMLNVFKDISN